MTHKLLQYFFIFVVFILVHLSYFQNGFTWLEHGDVEGKIAIRNISSIGVLFRQQYANTNFYRPVLTFFLSLDYALFQNNPVPYHITNLILMFLIVVISPVFLSSFVPLSNKEKLFVSLLLCVHPLAWLSTGSISYRPELLVILFSEVCIILHIKYRKTNSLIYCYLSLIFLILALFSKETAFVLIPLIIFAYEWKNREKTHLSIPYLFFIEEILAVIIFLILRYEAVGNLWSARNYPMNLSEHIGTRIVVIGKLTLMILTPTLPQLSDAIPITNLFNISVLLYLVIILSLIYLVIKSKDKSIQLGSLLIFITLTPALNIFSLPRFISPHYAFFSMIMMSFVIVLIIRRLNNKVKNFSIFFLLIITLFMGIQTYFGGTRFKNDYTLFYPDVVKDNNFLEGHYYLGDYYYSQGNIQKAESEYEASLVQNTKVIAYVDRTSALIKLANIKYLEKKYNQSEKLLSQAAQDPDPRIKETVVYNQASLAYEMGDYKKAEEILESSSISWKEKVNASRLLLSIYKKLGEEEKITTFLKKISQE